MQLELRISIKGQTEDDLQIGLDEIKKLINGGFTSGFDMNESGNYKFEITSLEREKSDA